MSREVCARDGLVRADQIENDTPVDIARSLAGGNLEIGQIYSSHGGFAVSFTLMSRLMAI
jgi:ABC-type taurine transport system substrate-binding protein